MLTELKMIMHDIVLFYQELGARIKKVEIFDFENWLKIETKSFKYKERLIYIWIETWKLKEDDDWPQGRLYRIDLVWVWVAGPV